MKIALLGFGGMGKVVREIALERGHEVPVIVDPNAKEATHRELSVSALMKSGGANVSLELEKSESSHKNVPGEGMREKALVDVVIDFSSGDAILDNVRICKEAGVNLIVGTTGWYEKLKEVKKEILEEKGNLPAFGFLWSSNFSIGVNMYFKVVEAAAKLVNKFDEYDVWGTEIHHYNKVDSPSGTAKTLEKILLENIERKTAVVEDKLDRKREMNEIHFSSVRGGLVNFGHTIGFDSAADRITITHEARCRDGYALGAVKAAEWLKGKTGYFEMEDFLKGV